MDGYQLLSSATVSGIIPVTKYRSEKTGFTVCIANVGGPLVNGYFCLGRIVRMDRNKATEAHDDDGLPHTLEHIVFMGSEEYPYKGMLDLLANRCLAQGTNAWTDTDHTCYTMTTAGSEGFLNLLPIYLDHLLYPTINDAHYITEVHHVNGEGEDAGVVYCEMQARENTGDSLTHLAFLRAMYPGVCGYKSETGGVMKNLRETCSHEKVKNYHKEFYRAENLCLIITGNVKPEDVFKAIKPFEDKILSKPTLPPYVRPWMNAVPDLPESVNQPIEFPTEDESTGMVKIGWRGPDVNAYYEIQGLKLLFTYLTETPVAPLQRDLVEIDDPECGDIDFTFFENKVTCILLSAENVPKENLSDIKDKIMGVLQKILSGEEAFDMDRMNTQIHRQILEEMNSVENMPHDALATLCIGDFLYSQDNKSLQEYIDKISHLRKLKTEKSEFWLNLMKRYVTPEKMVVVVGDPSEEKMKVMGENEKHRVKRQREDLGEEGLKSKKQMLEKAIEENSKEPPADLVNKLKVPSTESITFHNIQSYSNRAPAHAPFEEAKLFPVDKMPVAFYVNHTKSLFTQFTVMVDSSKLSRDLKMYLPLYTEILFESPILRDGKLLSYEEVVKELSADTLYTSSNIGVYGGGNFSPGYCSSMVTISFKVENEKYFKAVQWVKDILYNLQFSMDRLKSVANKLISIVPNHKRNGRRVVQSLLQNIMYDDDNNIYANNMIRQQAFLKKLIKDLPKSSEKILKDLQTLRKELLLPENLRIYVTANLTSLPENPHEAWFELFQGTYNVVDKVQKVRRDETFLSKKKQKSAIGIGSVESAYLLQTCSGVNSYNHPDYAAILVFIEYLCALEGPLWRQIRGCGYSYNYRISASPDTNTITFQLAKATHVFQAYKIAKQIVDDFASGKTPFDFGQLEAARSGMLYQTISDEETMESAVLVEVVSEFKDLEKGFNRKLLRQISEVTIEDLQRVGKTYFTNLFDPSVVAASLCCHPNNLQEILSQFKEIGVTFEDVVTLEDAFLKK